MDEEEFTEKMEKINTNRAKRWDKRVGYNMPELSTFDKCQEGKE